MNFTGTLWTVCYNQLFIIGLQVYMYTLGLFSALHKSH